MLGLLAMAPILTVAEVARVLRTLEGRVALAPRGIRYYARTGMVEPSGRMLKGKTSRTTRLYDVVDVALLRLVCRLRRQHVHERAVWGLLVYRGDELRELLASGSGELIVDVPAALAITSEDRTPPKPICIDVASLVSGLAERLAAYRRRHPEIWTGLAWVDAAQAAKQMEATA
jgi:DNA-binding transcriptional MerR regulator